MSKIDWLWLGGAAVWLGFGLYLVLLARRQASLERRLRQLEALGPDESETARGGSR